MGFRAVSGREVEGLPLLYHRRDNKFALKPVGMARRIGVVPRWGGGDGGGDGGTIWGGFGEGNVREGQEEFLRSNGEGVGESAPGRVCGGERSLLKARLVSFESL